MSWMRRYCDQESDREVSRLVHLCQGGALATDANCILWVNGNGGERAGKLGAIPDKFARAVTAYLAAQPSSDAFTTTLSDLWAWLDRVEREWCPQCHPNYGDVPCIYCNSDGWVFPYALDKDADRDTVEIGGVRLDRNRLAWWLAPELGNPNDSVAVWGEPGDGIKISHVYLVGFNWRLVIAGYASNSPSNRAGKSYRTYVPGAGVWWETRRQAEPACHPGTDWFIEQHGFEPTDLVKMWGRM